MKFKIFSIAQTFILTAVLCLFSTLTLASIKLSDGGVCPFPSYPAPSINNNEEGAVEFTMHINELGKVVDVEIIKSSGFKNLDNATKRNFKMCKFPPKILVPPETKWVKTQVFIWSIE